MPPYGKPTDSGNARHQSRQPKLSSNYDCQQRTAAAAATAAAAGQQKIRSGRRSVRSPQRPLSREHDFSASKAICAGDSAKSNRFNGSHRQMMPRIAANNAAATKPRHREEEEVRKAEDTREAFGSFTESRAIASLYQSQRTACSPTSDAAITTGDNSYSRSKNPWSSRSGGTLANSATCSRSFNAIDGRTFSAHDGDVSQRFQRSRSQRCYYSAAADQVPSEPGRSCSKSGEISNVIADNAAAADRIPGWIVRALLIMAESASADAALSEQPVNRLFARFLAGHADSIWSYLLRIIIDYANSYHPFSYDQLTNIRSCYERFVIGTLTPYAVRSFSTGTGNSDWLMVVLSFTAKNGPDVALGSQFVTGFLRTLAAQFPYGGYAFLRNLINRYQALYRPFTAEQMANVRRTFERFNKLTVDADFGRKITAVPPGAGESRKSPSLFGISDDPSQNIETSRDFLSAASGPAGKLAPTIRGHGNFNVLSPSSTVLSAVRSNFDSGQSSSGTTPSPVCPNETGCLTYGSGNDCVSSSGGPVVFSPQTASPYWA